MALHREHIGHIVELLGHVFTDALHLAATGAGARLWLVSDLAVRQMGWQGLEFGLLFGLRGRRRRLELLDLDGDRRQVGLDLVFEQAALLGVEALGLGGELHALEQRVLMAELGVERLALAQLGVSRWDHQPHTISDGGRGLKLDPAVKPTRGVAVVQDGAAVSYHGPQSARSIFPTP